MSARQLYFHIQALRHVRQCVSANDAKTVTTALVSSRLDYCNLILYRTSTSNLNILHVQNALARTVMMMKKHEHIKPVLAKLQWLPITAHIHFKALTTH